MELLRLLIDRGKNWNLSTSILIMVAMIVWVEHFVLSLLFCFQGQFINSDYHPMMNFQNWSPHQLDTSVQKNWKLKTLRCIWKLKPRHIWLYRQRKMFTDLLFLPSSHTHTHSHTHTNTHNFLFFVILFKGNSRKTYQNLLANFRYRDFKIVVGNWCTLTETETPVFIFHILFKLTCKYINLVLFLLSLSILVNFILEFMTEGVTS